MKRSKFTEQQIAFALKQAELRTPVEEVCRKIGIFDAAFYNWKKKYGGLGQSELRRLRQLEEENTKVMCWRRLNIDPPCRSKFDPGRALRF